MTKPLYIAGLGCRRGCSMQQLLELLLQALDQHHLNISDLSALASSSHKQGESGLQQLAMHLQLPLLFASAEQLSAYAERLTQHSPLSLRITGSAGVAQASALALAERLSTRRAELIGERLNSANATCAIAAAANLEIP
ncbi:MAG: cobalamin biosynthesis protein [Pseudomonas sp.]|uniref:cobalamin biosynthesis protein n=1 Tax=Pseudomonas sp. TaxID=306 RepID=UPI003BB5755F